MDKGDKYWPCPFCQKETVKVFHKPAHREAKVGRGSGQSSTTFMMVPEKIEVITKCENCGMSRTKIQKVLDGKLTVAEAKGEKKSTCMRCGKELENDKVRMCVECDEWYKQIMRK